MFVVRIKHFRRRLAAMAGGATLVAVLGLVLAGCFGRGADTEGRSIPADTNDERLAYLTELGWQVEPEPIETLHLQLPEELTGEYGDYAALQDGQGLPFAQFGGQTVSRYTYTVTNHPRCAGPVQVNLYVCDGQLIGGDVVAIGEDGFRQGLDFPK